ncbi:acyltransferase family protein [Cyanobium sp. ATX 6F1]|uniref:acyltransferase family protein n=1 Tax=unclassified Cyanobium TaxID=2627006 RepID=UPI0020CFD597|nr:acyltransferase [Cyanobium sp. ATX 6F1]MCP9914992.1 acyltransferase [Cyanobium sp. ATX 6F1]
MTTQGARNPGIDLIRSVCILYIVGFWHLLGYAPAIDGYKNDLTHRLTLVVLGLFMFVSGHLIGRSRNAAAKGWSSIPKFYKRRLIRIYPPYLLALLLFKLCGLLESGQLLPAVFLVSSLIGHQLRTLWFVEVLVVFYLLAPFLLLLRQSTGAGASRLKGAALLMMLIGADVLLSRMIPHSDPRLFFYFPAFATGVISASWPSTQPIDGPLPTRISTLTYIIPACIAAVVVSFGHGDFNENNLAIFPLALFGPWALFLVVNRLETRLRLPGFLLQLSLSSYFLYLFHRPVFWVFTSLISPSGATLQLIYLLVVCLPAAITTAWLGQRLYDRLLRRIQGSPSITV